MAALTGFLRVVGPTLAKPLLTAITPHHVIEIGQSSSSNNPNPVSTPPPKFESLEKITESLHVDRVEKNPLKQNGPALPVSIWEPVGGGFVRVRLDMPGASLVEVVPVAEEMSVKFKGVEQEIGMHGIGNNNNGVCRTYEGTLVLNPLRFSELDYNYKFFDGVLWFEFRCPNPATGSDLGVTVKPGRKLDAVPEIMEVSLYNPLMLHGKDRYCHHGFKDGWFVFAVDMPGIGEGDIMEISVVGSTVYYFVQDKEGRAYGESLDECRREYAGRFKLDGAKYDPKRAQFEISHGVFWIQVPKVANLPTTAVTLYHGTRRQDLNEEHVQ